jgi:tRNA(Ile)-lysidine synthetase-like protein
MQQRFDGKSAFDVRGFPPFAKNSQKQGTRRQGRLIILRCARKSLNPLRPRASSQRCRSTHAAQAGSAAGGGLSGGADSVALLRALAERSGELGLVLHVAHLHHGLRGEEADGDLEFAARWPPSWDCPFTRRGWRRRRGKGQREKAGETIEEAARRLRYGWFRQLMASGEVEAVATAHTRDDQAETVLPSFCAGPGPKGSAAFTR